MNDDKSPAERLFDLLVFGPAGLAITAAEEFPKLVEKGRHRVEGQVQTARIVGQFAVQMGRRQVEQAVEGLLSKRQGGSPAHSADPSRSKADTAEDRSPEDRSPEDRSADSGSTAPAVVRGGSLGPAARSANGTMASAALGIPGYDSLSASQVVQRLPGLSAAELAAVAVHEQDHRHRRTILNRVAQLLDETGPG